MLFGCLGKEMENRISIGAENYFLMEPSQTQKRKRERMERSEREREKRKTYRISPSFVKKFIKVGKINAFAYSQGGNVMINAIDNIQCVSKWIITTRKITKKINAKMILIASFFFELELLLAATETGVRF